MLNTSCQQLTVGLQNIQKLNAEFLGDDSKVNRQKTLKSLKDLKEWTRELYDQILVEIDEDIKLCIQDYDEVSQFAKDNNLELDSDLFMDHGNSDEGFITSNNRIIGLSYFTRRELNLKSLKNLTKLASVILYSTTITNHSLDSNKNIQFLELSHSIFESPDGFGFLENMISLRELNVSNTSFSDEDLVAIKNLPIETLEINDCSHITDFKPLLEMPDLREVVISKVSTSTEINQFTSKLEVIETLRDRSIYVTTK